MSDDKDGLRMGISGAARALLAMGRNEQRMALPAFVRLLEESIALQVDRESTRQGHPEQSGTPSLRRGR